MENRIIVDPKIMLGKPVVKGTRITVEHILQLLKQGIHVQDIVKDLPQLTVKDIEAAVDYAAEAVSKERAYPL